MGTFNEEKDRVENPFLWKHKTDEPEGLLSLRSFISSDWSTYRNQRTENVRSQLDWCRVILIVSCSVFVAVLTITTGVLSAQIETNIKLQRNEENTMKVCIECMKIVSDPSEFVETDPLLRKLTRKMDNGHLMCCGQDMEQISIMFEAAVRKRDINRALKQKNKNAVLKFTPVSFHKQLLSVNDDELGLKEPYMTAEPVRFSPRLRADYNDPLTEHARGVRVLNSSVEILYTGLYYIYASAHFQPKSNKPAKEFLSSSWFHYVYRRKPNNPSSSGLLLQITHTAHDNSTDDQATGFAGGTFYLNKGDIIDVCINGLGLLNYQKESTFLGMFMIESEPK